MDSKQIAGLLEQRRTALVEFCIGQVKKTEANPEFDFLRTPADLFELLRMDPLDSYPVQSSWVAEATGCAQQFIHAAYRKLEPGYETKQFPTRDLEDWELYSNYPDWAAVQQITLYPEKFMLPEVRQRKTSLFKALENNLNQTRLSTDSVQLALQEYLQALEQTCNLDVISGYIDGASAASADYYFIGRQRVAPFQYFWRKAEVELEATSDAINPAAWGEWQAIEVPVAEQVLDARPVFWGGRLCLVWAEWRPEVKSKDGGEYAPNQLVINLAFMMQNGHWSAPFVLHKSEPANDVSQGARLIATVWVDAEHPKGKLGVLLTNRAPVGEAAPANPVDVYLWRNVLLRTLESDGFVLEALASFRFVSRDTLQHPLLHQSPLTIVETIASSGNLTAYYSFQAVVLRNPDGQDVLVVRGGCDKNTVANTPPQRDFDLTMASPSGGDPAPIKENRPTRGDWHTALMGVKRPAGSFTTPTSFTFGETTAAGAGRKRYVVTAPALQSFAAPRLEKPEANDAQFLALSQPGFTLKHIRLNSLFGPELVQRGNISIDAVLDWETQFLKEPNPASGPIKEENGPFDGANGLFFWEMFFHLPHLVASRLRAEDRYLEAQKWLHYLFDPLALPDSTTTPAKPLYWRCGPLRPRLDDTFANPGYEALAPTDPDAIGYSAPVHFRKCIFIEYVNNLIAWGDWYFRQLTRDSLAAAKLCYVQAEFLMGKAPSFNAVNRWQTTTVADLLHQASSRPELEAFEQNLVVDLGKLPVKAKQPPLLGLLANEPFVQPINEQLLAMFELPGRRLYNLRNNLTLDGKPLQIPLFSPPTDPNQLLRDQLAGGVGSPRPMGGQLYVGAFRWSVFHDAAMGAVQTLQEYGNQVLRLLEQRDRAEMEEMQQNHLVELGAYAQSAQEQAIAQLEANVTALGQSRTLAQERAAAYAARYDENITAVEYDVMDTLQLAKQMSISAKAIKGAGAVIASLPNIFGMANGGYRGEKLADAIVYGLDLGADLLQMDAEKKATTEAYRRRREDWGLQRDQALAEVRAIDEQITAQSHAVTAAKTNLEQTLKANSQTLKLYNFMKKRFTNAELFGWLLGQAKALHYQTYDAVVSLCLSAQASLSAETGDYDSQLPLPQVWQDNRHGLMSGNHWHAYLTRMKSEYLQRFERRLELIKTISLRQLFDDPVDPQLGFSSWQSAVTELQQKGSLEFRFTQLLFDRDYPGHYCRQISAIDVYCPVVAGPFENVKATLLQITSMTATRPSARSVEYLHQPDGAVAPVDVQFNLRSGQQIGLSVGIADAGMTARKPDEGLLNPFECTGAVSRWTLNCPWPGKAPQQAMLASLTDVIVEVRYTSKVGDQTFRRKVEELVNEAESRAQLRIDKGAGDHA